MNKRMYDIAMLLGVLLMTAGVWVQWGAGLALICAGGLVVALTVFGAAVSGRKR